MSERAQELIESVRSGVTPRDAIHEAMDYRKHGLDPRPTSDPLRKLWDRGSKLSVAEADKIVGLHTQDADPAAKKQYLGGLLIGWGDPENPTDHPIIRQIKAPRALSGRLSADLMMFSGGKLKPNKHGAAPMPSRQSGAEFRWVPKSKAKL